MMTLPTTLDEMARYLTKRLNQIVVEGHDLAAVALAPTVLALLVTARQEAEVKMRERAAEVAESSYHRAKTQFELPCRGEANYAANQKLHWSEAYRPAEIADAIRALPTTQEASGE